MDVLDEKKLAEIDITPALNRLESQIIPAAAAALSAAAKGIVTDLQDVIRAELDQALIGIQKAEDRAAGIIAEQIAALDGWTLTVDPITIRLNRPK